MPGQRRSGIYGQQNTAQPSGKTQQSGDRTSSLNLGFAFEVLIPALHYRENSLISVSLNIFTIGMDVMKPERQKRDEDEITASKICT